ncbi:MAG: M56 family metallopeptidase [Flavobacteriaceae bacterium]|nr:M56 family metallopeptidase [Flavobacteriaceae bacterium]
MELYIIKSVACLGIFFFFYKHVLEKTSNHIFKRYYLLGAVILALVIPLITFTQYAETESIIPTVVNATDGNIIPVIEESFNYFSIIFWSLYLMGVVFFGSKFAANLFIIISRIKKNPTLRDRHIFHVLLRPKVTPHTFFQFVFLNKESYEANEIPEEVLWHEWAHAKQLHSLDVVLLEFLQVIFWFNPFLYLLKRSVKLNHEFLADTSVLKKGVETSEYQNILLAYSSNAVSPQLANSINYSSIKKRFTVMKTKTSQKSRNLRILLLLPLLAFALYSFSSFETIYKDVNELAIQEGATAKQISEYNALAKKYNAVDIKERVIKLKELKRLETIYRLMTPAQKAKAEPFPECYPPPPPPPPVTDAPKPGNKLVPPPPPPPAPDTEMVPPPPPPPNPMDHLIELAKKGAKFYYEGTSITSDRAIEILKQNKSLNISVQEKNRNTPRVDITKAGITIKN